MIVSLGCELGGLRGTQLQEIDVFEVRLHHHETGVGLGAVAASSLAALTAGFLAQVVASRLRVPALALSMAAIVPLLPGLAVYTGLFQIVQRSPETGLSTGLTTLLGAAGIGMGLAAGVSMGTFLARPIRAELDRGQRRALRRSAGDPRE